MAYLKRAGQIQLKPVEWSNTERGLKFLFVTKEVEECSGLFDFTKKDGSPNETIDLVSAAFEEGKSLLMEVKESPDGKYFNAKWAVTKKDGAGNKSSADLKAYLAKRASEPKAPEGAPTMDGEVPF